MEIKHFDDVHFVLFDIISTDEFFTPALADGLSLEIEWQQVSTSFQDSFRFCSWS